MCIKRAWFQSPATFSTVSVVAGWAIYFRKQIAVSFAHALIGRHRLATCILQKKGRQDEELFVAVRGLGRLLGVRPCGR